MLEYFLLEKNRKDVGGVRQLNEHFEGSAKNIYIVYVIQLCLYLNFTWTVSNLHSSKINWFTEIKKQWKRLVFI